MRSIFGFAASLLLLRSFVNGLPRVQDGTSGITTPPSVVIAAKPTPRARIVMERRATSSATSTTKTTSRTTGSFWVPTPAPKSGPAVFVIDSTIITSLHPAVCGFMSGSSSIAVVGCGSESYFDSWYISTSIHSYGSCASATGTFYCAEFISTWKSYETFITGCDNMYDYNRAYSGSWVTTSLSNGASTWTSWWDGPITVSELDATLTTYTSRTWVYDSNYDLTHSLTTLVGTASSSYKTFITTQNIQRLTCLSSYYNRGCATQTTRFGGRNLTRYGCETAASFYGTITGVSDLLKSFQGSTITLTSRSSELAMEYSVISMYASRPAPTSVTAPSGYFNLIKKNPPSCVNALNSTCTKLYTAAVGCWSEPYPRGPTNCTCDALIDTNCTNICSDNVKGLNRYYNWVLDLCHKQPNFTTKWPEMQNRTAMLAEGVLPWKDWKIQANSSVEPNPKCASRRVTAGSLAMVNGITYFAIFLVGQRHFMKWVTFGLFGKRDSRLWVAMAFVMVGLNLVANYLNVFYMRRVVGYSELPVWTFIVFWTTRPRLDWIAGINGTTGKEKNAFTSLAASVVLAEAMLQGICGISMVRTVIYASKQGFYKPNALEHTPSRKYALIMYIGAVIWIISMPPFLLFMYKMYMKKPRREMILWTLWKPVSFGAHIIRTTSKREWFMREIREKKEMTSDSDSTDGNDGAGGGHNRNQNSTTGTAGNQAQNATGATGAAGNSADGTNTTRKNDLTKKGMDEKFLKDLMVVFLAMLVPFAAQWIFTIGFLGLYGDRYCPPHIWTMAAIWSVQSVFGIFLGNL